MAYCGKCGTQVNDGMKFCPACKASMGNAASEQADTQANDFSSKVTSLNNTADTTAEFDKADIENNKLMGILSYISWLVLIPLFVSKDSKFVRFHSNQGLVLALIEAVWWVAQKILSSVLWTIFGYRLWGIYSLLIMILGLVNIVFFIMSIIGIINAINGRAKELPVIGKFRIIK
jgi:uncharacterized membrane protein